MPESPSGHPEEIPIDNFSTKCSLNSLFLSLLSRRLLDTDDLPSAQPALINHSNSPVFISSHTVNILVTDAGDNLL